MTRELQGRDRPWTTLAANIPGRRASSRRRASAAARASCRPICGRTRQPIARNPKPQRFFDLRRLTRLTTMLAPATLLLAATNRARPRRDIHEEPNDLAVRRALEAAASSSSMGMEEVRAYACGDNPRMPSRRDRRRVRAGIGAGPERHHLFLARRRTVPLSRACRTDVPSGARYRNLRSVAKAEPEVE
jgi:hypothetical protein